MGTMTVRVLSLIPTPSPELVRAKVLFERRKEFGSTPVATEGAAVELHIETTGSYADLQQRAIEKAREFLTEAASAIQS